LHPSKEDINRRTYGDLDVSDAALTRQPENFLEEIRAQIDECSNPKEVALIMNWPKHGEGNELGNRSRQVNFVAAARADYAPYTIEFRQARGTLNAEDVTMRVELCTGLVRLAQFYVENPGKVPMKTFKPYLVGEDGEVVVEKFDIMDLMTDMEMSEEDKLYWRTRIARYAARGGPLDRVDNEKEPEDGKEGQGIPGSGGNDDDDSAFGSMDGSSKADALTDSQSKGTSGGDNSESRSSGNNDGGRSRTPSTPTSNRQKRPLTQALAKRPVEDDDSQQGRNRKEQRIVSPFFLHGSHSIQKANCPKEIKPPRSSAIVGTIGIIFPTLMRFLARRASAISPTFSPNLRRLIESKLPPVRPPPPSTGQSDQPQFSPAIIGGIGTIFPTLLSFLAPRGPPLSLGIPLNFASPTEGMVAPIGTMSPIEAHIFLGSVWAVKDFDMGWWRVKHTGIRISTPTGERLFVCAVNAVLQSMKDQFPLSTYATITAADLLAGLDTLVGREVNNDVYDQELALLVDRWTNGQCQVIIVSDALDHKLAYRGGYVDRYPEQHRTGRNLYVRHQVSTDGKGGGHWESMERRETRRGSFEETGASEVSQQTDIPWFT
jgi:hypothetical protein